jgi:hypothetical protein
MLTAEAAVTAAEEGCNRGELVGLKKAWPPSIGCGHGRAEALEEARVVVEVEADIAGAAERKVACGWDEESIAEGRESVLICLGL